MGMARRLALGASVFAIIAIGGTSGTQNAVANGDTRTLTLYHNHTKESLTVTFRRNGQYDPRALEQLNWFLRDWRRDEPTQMDPRLFDTVWEVYREVGSSEPIHVNSAYRSPQTNAMLRRRSSAVAKNSQHMRGKAMDFYLPDVSIDRIRAAGMRWQNGGVGYYPNAYTPFVHLDVGSVRAWPRMTRDQLARIFPDGKTVHIPTDGIPFPRYEEAKAEVIARGFTVGGITAVAEAEEGAAQPTRRKSLWATLFGGGDDDEDAAEIRNARSNREVYVARRAPPPNIYGNSDSVYATLQPNIAPSVQSRPQRPVAVAQAEPEPILRQEPALPPIPRTRIAGLPSTVETPTGPKLIWQQGAGGQTPNLPAKGGIELALAPLPPRRPEDVVTTGALSYAPMPPIRPGSLAASDPILPAASGSREPAVTAAVPLPPPRPDVRPVTVAALGAAQLPQPQPPAPHKAPKNEGAQSREPASGSVPVPATQTKTPAAAPMAAPAPNAKLKAAPSPSSVATASTNSASTAIGLQMGFSTEPPELPTNRFTGSAVKPLSALR